MNSKVLVVALVFLVVGGAIYVQNSSIIPPNLEMYPDNTWQSEVRGVFIKSVSDWNLVAETCVEYDVNWMVYEAFGTYFARYPSNIVPQWGEQRDYIREGIDACHSRGIKFYVLMLVNFGGDWADMGDTKVVLKDGSSFSWVCPTKQVSRNKIKAIVEEVATRYPDLDGVMLDYLRFQSTGMCYCSECKAKFIADTGKTDVVWSTDVIEGGKYYNDFLEWRNNPVFEEGRDIITWMRAINPRLEFGIASFTLFQNSGSYWRKYIGQDTARLVKTGLLDVVNPMMYTTNLGSPDGITDYINSNREFIFGAEQGTTKFVPVITDGVTSPVAPAAFKAVVDKVREMKCDGWIIYMYGGPGSSHTIDIRNYLALLSHPQTFNMTNIKLSKTDDSVTVSWQTSTATSGKVEYSLNPFWTWNEVMSYNWPCWQASYVQGQLVNDIVAYEHHVTLTNLQKGKKYHFRIWSTGNSYTLTSQTFIFF